MCCSVKETGGTVCRSVKSPEHQEKGPDITRPGMPLSPDEGIASSGVTFHLWRLYQHAWLVCLFFPLAQLVREPVSPWQVALRLLALCSVLRLATPG